MKSLNICIDIDGTITDAYYWLEMCNKRFNKNLKAEDATEYYIHKVYGISQQEYDDFYEQNKFIMHSNQQLRPDVKFYLDQLVKHNNIYFVTARDKSLTLLTHSYLRDNQIPYDGLYVLNSHYKLSTAESLNCDIFIEDNYDIANQLSASGIKVLLINTHYNQGPINHNTTRVNDWNEIFTTIDEMVVQYSVV